MQNVLNLPNSSYLVIVLIQYSTSKCVNRYTAKPRKSSQTTRLPLYNNQLIHHQSTDLYLTID